MVNKKILFITISLLSPQLFSFEFNEESIRTFMKAKENSNSITTPNSSKSSKSSSDSTVQGKKNYTAPEEIPASTGSSTATRYNEIVSFIYADAYNRAYNLALLRCDSIHHKTIYKRALEILKSTDMESAIETDDLSETQFYAYYNTVFTACMNEFSTDLKKSAKIFTAGFANINDLVVEVVIHYSVYLAVLEFLFKTRRKMM